jgi:hypothetical protein
MRLTGLRLLQLLDYSTVPEPDCYANQSTSLTPCGLCTKPATKLDTATGQVRGQNVLRRCTPVNGAGNNRGQVAMIWGLRSTRRQKGNRNGGEQTCTPLCSSCSKMEGRQCRERLKGKQRKSRTGSEGTAGTGDTGFGGICGMPKRAGL